MGDSLNPGWDGLEESSRQVLKTFNNPIGSRGVRRAVRWASSSVHIFNTASTENLALALLSVLWFIVVGKRRTDGSKPPAQPASPTPHVVTQEFLWKMASPAVRNVAQNRRTDDLIGPIFMSSIGQWVMILSLIFGGCCSNAWALEIATSQNPRAGSLITFAQFVLVTLFGIRRRFTSMPPADPKASRTPSLWKRISRLRLRPLAVPITRWLIQVAFYLALSLLNNAAFGYKIPMAVHIVFRSGGLVMNVLIGWLTLGRKYRPLQVLAILIITVGIIAATSSGTKPKDSPIGTTSSSGPSYTEYSIGISMLTLALVLSTFLGFSQEYTFAKYGRSHWEEGMFFLHFLSLPMFAIVGGNLKEQISFANASERISIVEPLYVLFAAPSMVARDGSLFARSSPSMASLPSWPRWLPKPPLPPLETVTVPSFWITLAINVTTQLVCVSGVNRLTSRVSSLTLTLILALRKAVSLIISVVLIGHSSGSIELWLGSVAVLVGTVLYALASGRQVLPKSVDTDQDHVDKKGE